MVGIIHSVRKMFDDGLAAAQNRVELFGLELQEEKWRFIEAVVLVLGAFFLAMMAVLLLTATILFSFRGETRVYVAAGLSALYGAGALWAYLWVKKRLKNDPLPFADSAEQLRKDREWLESLK